MRFFNAGGELDGLPHRRTYAEELAMALSALDSVLVGERAVYGSSELTTGLRLYGLLREHGVRTASEFKEKLGEAAYRRLLWDPNVQQANEFARRLRDRLGGALTVSPGPFTAPGWTQPEYLGFWETLIRTRFRAVYFNHGWQYSNGCAFELAVAHDAGLPVYDADGAPLAPAQGAAQIAAAVAELAADGFDVTKLRESLARLETRFIESSAG